MLKKKFRLPRGIRFNNSSLLSAPLFTIKTKENGFLFNRFAIVISKKIDKRAVVRNRIKRLISSSLEELYGDIKQGYDMLFIVKKSALHRSREEMRLSINDIIKKV